MAHRDEHLLLCAGFVVGDLGDEERRSLEAHLAEGCAVCRAEIDRLGRTAYLVASAAPTHRAPMAVRARVLDAVRAEAAGERVSRPTEPLAMPPRRRPMTWAWAAAAVLALAAGIWHWRVTADLETEIAAARNEVAALEAKLQLEEEWTAFWAAPHTKEIRLEPTPDGSKELVAKVTYDPDSKRAVVALSNFTPPSGKDYQLWAITASGPASLGVIHADSAGNATIRLTDVGATEAPAAFAVSLEALGGAPTPHAPAGPVVLVGKVGA